MNVNNNQLSRVLQHYMNFVCLQKTDWRFCRVLVEKVVPLLSRHSLYRQWQKEKEEYFSQRTSLENLALADLKKTFLALKKRLIEAGLMTHSATRQRVCIIESIFEFCRKDSELLAKNHCDCGASLEKHNPYIFPSYIYGIYKELAMLCDEIMDLRRYDLLAGYIVIQCISTYVHDPNIFQRRRCRDCNYLYNRSSACRDTTGGPIPFYALDSEWVCPGCGAEQSDFLLIDSDMVFQTVPSTECFTFASRYFALSCLDETFRLWKHQPSEGPAWVAHEILSSVQWATKISPDFLRKKKLGYEDQTACVRSARLLQLHDFRIAIGNIKQKKQRRNQSFYKRARFIQALSVIQKTFVEEYEEPFPLSIELKMEDHICLRLRIEWLPGLFEVCDLHLFKELEKTENNIYRFIEDMIDQLGKISTLDPFEAPGANATKYLKRAGICKLLENIFISNKTTYGACLSKTYINLTGKSEIILHKLSRKISNCRTDRWE